MKTAAPPPFSTLDVASVLGVVLIWGLNFVAIKLTLHDFTPFQLGAARYVFAALPLVLLVRRPRMPARWLIGYGLAQGVGQFGLLFVALQLGMTAALASVLMQTQAFFTTLLGAVWLKERIGGALRVGLLLAAIGLACFVLNFVGPADRSGTTLPGLLLNLGAAFMWGIANIVTRRAQRAYPDYDPLQFVVWSSLVPILPFVALSLVTDPPELRWRWLDASASSWAGAVFLGWIATVLAYGLWTGLFKRHAASRVSPFSLGVPVVGLMAGMGLMGDRVTAWQWAGIAFVISALAVVMLGARLQRAIK